MSVLWFSVSFAAALVVFGRFVSDDDDDDKRVFIFENCILHTINETKNTTQNVAVIEMPIMVRTVILLVALSATNSQSPPQKLFAFQHAA